MKTLLILFSAITIVCNAQENYGDALFRAQMSEMAGHNYATIFCGRELNAANLLLGQFLDEYAKLVEDSSNYDVDYVTYYYKGTGTPKNLDVKYKVRDNGDGYYYIESVDITGSSDKVIYLFLSYWPTEMQKGNLKKNEWLYYNLLTDRIGLYVDVKGSAIIKIDNNQKN